MTRLSSYIDITVCNRGAAAGPTPNQMACADASAESIQPCIYKNPRPIPSKTFSRFLFYPHGFPFFPFSSITNQIRRWRHSSYNPLQWSPHTHTHTHTQNQRVKRKINQRQKMFCRSSREPENKTKKKQTCAMLPVGSRKCCTYVLHILFLGTPDRNTWRKTHTFHQVPTRPAALSFTPCFLSLSLFFSLVFLSLTKYVSSLFTRPNLQQQHSTCLRLYLYKASGQKHGLWCPACQTLHQRAI
jgi:hypothetical protein